ncbi:maltase A1-like [Agrilus planipennis]|uniref:Maltase A1-like n=1 Tax=Agrilus planipennis TaxID=224129 RepID=A0A7F5R745_AGRPL|nr:maltase A1-like [Agrilus planipennis]
MSALRIVIIFTTLLNSLIEAEIVYNGSSTAKDDWWKYATFYQIYPRSFKDSDGDGMGDLNGITSKLQHLVNAGITAAWLSPIFKSPGVDAGYDISDFRDIDEKFGTMSDFEQLIKTAHELGLKIILDYVPNHTSDQHVWFQLSKNKTEGYKDYFIWKKGYNSTAPPNNWVCIIIFSISYLEVYKWILMTEAWESTNLTMMFYGNETNEGVTFPFNFKFITDLSTSTSAQDLVNVILEWLNNMPEGKVANWVLGNHDNFRAASRLGVENVDGYNMLTTLLPGVAVTYNGEEIGMEDGEVTWEEGQDPRACNGLESEFNTESRDFERTPFHWDSTANAGFSTANKTWLPVSSKYRTNNLELQSREGEKSHFHIYQSLMKLRKENTFIFGNLDVEVLAPNVLAYTRALDGNDTYVFIFNNGGNSTTVSLSPFKSVTGNMKVVLSSTSSSRNEGDILSIENINLGAHEAIVAKSGSNNLVRWSIYSFLFIVLFLFRFS